MYPINLILISNLSYSARFVDEESKAPCLFNAAASQGKSGTEPG